MGDYYWGVGGYLRSVGMLQVLGGGPRPKARCPRRRCAEVWLRVPECLLMDSSDALVLAKGGRFP